jgi:hypothetical protein
MLILALRVLPSDYPPIVQHFVENNYVAITCVGLPFLLMLVDAWLKNWQGFDWKTYGADTAMCGVGVLTSAVFAAAWTSTTSLGAAILILFIHGLLWSVVLWVAAKKHHLYQAMLGSVVCSSCLFFALYYLHGASK